MRRRNRLAATFVALVTVGTILLSTPTRHPVQAADPLAQAKLQQEQLHATLSEQRARLAELKAQSASLSHNLDVAKAELAQVTAEYEHVKTVLGQVTDQIADIRSQLADLRARIADLDVQLDDVAAQIVEQSHQLDARESLLEEHLRAAYERSQTSLLEILISADSLDDATTQVSWMLEMSGQDAQLADEIRTLRSELETRRETLRQGRADLADARHTAREQRALLKDRQAQLDEMRRELARLKAAADQKRREQESALNAALEAKGNVQAAIAANVKAARQTDSLVARLQAEAAARQAAIEEAKRRAAAAAAAEARRQAQQPPPVSERGFRWPEAGARLTQEWGPTSFELEPPYTYHGTYYPHFHTGIDMVSGCNAPIVAAGTGVVVSSGQPSWPFDTAYGVIIDHGGGIMTLYWHMQPRVIVSPGQAVTIGQVIGYEGTTGNSTGCHLHFAVNDNGVWENPRNYLP